VTENPESSMREKADAALRLAAVKVIERARRHGTRIIVCEDNQIVERSWQEMERILARKSIPLGDETAPPTAGG
jgi:hypothetical protein